MCGRSYSTYSDEELIFRYLNRKKWRWPVSNSSFACRPNYNMCPSQVAPVLCVADGELGFRNMRWGLVPSWAKSVKDADRYSMINAKSEEITEKRSYKVAFQKRRCIIPVSGFYEWKRSEKAKIPYAIQLRSDPIMSLAGVWERWQSSGDEEAVESFSIITMEANSFMSKIHNRMPVILDRESEEQWLDPALVNAEQIKPLMKDIGSGELYCFQVSTKVNSPKNNSADCLDPVLEGEGNC